MNLQLRIPYVAELVRELIRERYIVYGPIISKVKAKCSETMDALNCQCAEGEAKLEEWKSPAEDAG